MNNDTVKQPHSFAAVRYTPLQLELKVLALVVLNSLTPQVEAFLPPPVNRQVISTMNIITTWPKPFKTDSKCHG
jgi:hypothetical protein